jgi:hypothetical protein
MSKLGWYSADHHVHAAGCSHYESPEEGVPPVQMWRQVLGEDLNIAAVLTWGPSWYHQKTFFTGKDDPLSNTKNIMRNDVEVSGFPSSHAGHVVLHLEDDYPEQLPLNNGRGHCGIAVGEITRLNYRLYSFGLGIGTIITNPGL